MDQIVNLALFTMDRTVTQSSSTSSALIERGGRVGVQRGNAWAYQRSYSGSGARTRGTSAAAGDRFQTDRRVSQTGKKTNEWVLNPKLDGVNRELLDTVKARKLAYTMVTP